MNDKFYEVEFKSTTYRVYEVKANSQEEAEKKAFAELDMDYKVSKEWRKNAEIIEVDQINQKELDCRPWLTYEDEDELHEDYYN